MSTIDKIYKKEIKNLLFYEYKKEDNKFSFIDEDIMLPLIRDGLKRNEAEKSIQISSSAVYEGSALYISGADNRSIETLVKKMTELAPHLYYNVMNASYTSERKYLIISGIIKVAGETEGLIDARTVLAREILEGAPYKDDNEIKRQYEIDLSKLYAMTSNAKYALYLGLLYEHEGQLLKARLIYGKGMQIDSEALDGIRERYNQIYSDSVLEMADYYIETREYEKALDELGKLPLNRKVVVRKAICMNETGERDELDEILRQYLDSVGGDEEIEEWMKKINL